MSRDRYRNSGPLFRKVFVGNLGDRATQLELEGAFSCFGPLRSVWIARNPPGFAFVEFEDPDNALEAVRALDGSILCGCPVRVELARANPRSSDRTPASPERCYACGERGHYARDCYLQYADNVGPENELGEGFGDISELCLDPETYEGCDWNSVIELMGIQPRTHNQRNRRDDSSSSGYQDPSNEPSRNTAQLQNRSDRSRQGDWYDSPSQRVWFDSPLQQRGDRLPQQNRSYTPQQSNWDGSLPQRNMSNRAQQQNWGPQRTQGDRPSQQNWGPQRTQGDRPSQQIWINSPLHRRNDGPLLLSRSNRPPQRHLDDTPPQRYLDDRPPRWYLHDTPPQQYLHDTPPQQYLHDTPPQQYLHDTPPQRYLHDTPPQHRGDRPPQRYLDDRPPRRYLGDRLSQRYLHDTPPQRRGDRPPQRNRSDRSQPQPTSGGTASHSSVSNKLNDTSDDIKCAICLDTEGDTEMEYLPCGHGFHAKCCNDWLSVNSLCPICRTSVASQSANVQDNPERNVDNIPTFFIGSVWLA